MSTENIRGTTDILLALSIIVPVYNVEPWLARCLDSLLGQTKKDIEIICIDDKSTDDSLKILREYGKKDKRIKIIEQEKNSGVSAARNAGLEIATGEYLGFVDSDDFVDSDFYEKLYSRATETDADIVKGKVIIVSYDGKESSAGGPSFADIRKSRANFTYSFWSAIFRHEFIIKNKLNFPDDLIICEDAVFIAKAALLANTIEFAEDTSYHYFKRKNSLYFKDLNIEKLKSSIKSKNMIIDFINDNIANNKKLYDLVFEINFKWLLYSEYNRSQTFGGCLIVIQGAIGLYKKCKYKDDLNKKLDRNHAKFLSEENEVALFADLSKRTDRVVRFKLFNYIPLLKIIYRYSRIEMTLFRYIPLMRIKIKHDGDYYYLFFRFPIMKREAKN